MARVLVTAAEHLVPSVQCDRTGPRGYVESRASRPDRRRYIRTDTQAASASWTAFTWFSGDSFFRSEDLHGRVPRWTDRGTPNGRGWRRGPAGFAHKASRSSSRARRKFGVAETG